MGCLACELMSGARDLPGGRVHETEHWVVEHCVGPLGVGTLLVKPRRHVLHVSELTDEESAQMGPVLRLAARAVEHLLQPDQVYVCLWSHAGWEPVHIHFVVQPAWNRWREEHAAGGPFIQAAMFAEGCTPPRAEVEEFCDRARRFLAQAETGDA